MEDCTMMCTAPMCTHRSSGSEKGVKTLTLALIEGPQGADSGPEAVGSFGHQHQDLFFHLGHKLACGIRANSFQERGRVSHLDTYTGILLRRSPGGKTLSTSLSDPDTSTGASGAPGEVRLQAASIEAAGTGVVPVPLAVGLSAPLGLFGAAG
jgi:hypothetical protein